MEVVDLTSDTEPECDGDSGESPERLVHQCTTCRESFHENIDLVIHMFNMNHHRKKLKTKDDVAQSQCTVPCIGDSGDRSRGYFLHVTVNPQFHAAGAEVSSEDLSGMEANSNNLSYVNEVEISSDDSSNMDIKSNTIDLCQDKGGQKLSDNDNCGNDSNIGNGNDSKLKTLRSLRAQMVLHSGVWKFQCPECDKIYVHLKTLRHHMSLHSEEAPHQCHLCNRAFTRAPNLKRHQLAHHIRSPTQRYRINVNSVRQKIEPTLYKCVFCGKTFRFKSDYLSHINTHNGL